MSTINVPAATREEYRLVFGIARMAARDDLTVAAINKVASWQEALWGMTDQAQAQRQQEAQQHPPPQTPPSAVETHGIESEEAQKKREMRKANRLATEQARREAKAAIEEEKRKTANHKAEIRASEEGQTGQPPAEKEKKKEE